MPLLLKALIFGAALAVLIPLLIFGALVALVTHPLISGFIILTAMFTLCIYEEI